MLQRGVSETMQCRLCSGINCSGVAVAVG